MRENPESIGDVGRPVRGSAARMINETLDIRTKDRALKPTTDDLPAK
jgi:hypothetical protein